MIGVAGLGLLASLGMRALPLHTDVNRKWALEEAGENGKGGGKLRQEEQDKEKGVAEEGVGVLPVISIE